ncbi:hypothetical protein BC831DRAFT_476443, partial [Entophlyctis helioformis]
LVAGSDGSSHGQPCHCRPSTSEHHDQMQGLERSPSCVCSKLAGLSDGADWISSATAKPG